MIAEAGIAKAMVPNFGSGTGIAVALQGVTGKNLSESGVRRIGAAVLAVQPPTTLSFGGR